MSAGEPSASVRIRAAERADIPDIARVRVDTWRATYRDLVPEEALAKQSYAEQEQGVAAWFEVGQQCLFVAENGQGEIVGYATGGPPLEAVRGYSCQLYTLYLLPDYQRLGIGTRLFEAVASALQAQGHSSLSLWVLEQNPARRFYEALGGNTLRESLYPLGGAQLKVVAYGWADITILRDNLQRRNRRMAERTVTFKGNPVPLAGPELKPGDTAPDFKLQERTAAGLEDISLANFAGKTLLLSVVPSLDTPVCAIQTKKFNEKAAQLPENVAIVTVSADLPFAQARFCGAEGVDKLQCASDHRDVSFGEAYGTLIAAGPLSRVLARAIFVVDPAGKLKHVEYVAEIGSEPNYDAALAAVA